MPRKTTANIKDTQQRTQMNDHTPVTTYQCNSIHAPRTRRRRRFGSVLGLMAFLLPVLTILAAFCINTAQVQLTRTELMIATDAAAKAGGRAFSELQSTSAAKKAARITAARNNVQGQPLRIRTSNSANQIEFGRTEQLDGDSGRYSFTKVPTSKVAAKNQLANAVRVIGRRDADSKSGRVPLLLPGLLKLKDFSAIQDATAMQVDRDIALVLDRSGSMSEAFFNWPHNQSPWNRRVLNAGVKHGLLTRKDGNYYYRSGVNSTSYQQWAWQKYFKNGPAPKSPWDDLELAVDAFLKVLETTCQHEQVAVASYATTAAINSTLRKDFKAINSAMNTLSPSGMTAIGKGMQEGHTALFGKSTRPYAAKSMVVMTDGIHNTGISPEKVAEQLVKATDLLIHTVTFGKSADQELMQRVSEIGGGKHYHAKDGGELIQAFEEIANNLPTILIE